MRYKSYAFRTLTNEERFARVVAGQADSPVDVRLMGIHDEAHQAHEDMRRRGIAFQWGWVQKFDETKKDKKK